MLKSCPSVLVALMWMHCSPTMALPDDLSPRDAIYSFYLEPNAGQNIRINATKAHAEVEICTDACDLFIAKGSPDNALLWEAIFLFKGAVADSNDDLVFREKNVSQVNRLLEGSVFAKGCKKPKSTQHLALCALKAYSKKIGFAHADVKYDEGSRCSVFRSFEIRSRIVRSKCENKRDLLRQSSDHR